MTVPTTYPGVYIEEIPSGVRTINGMATPFNRRTNAMRIAILTITLIITFPFASYTQQQKDNNNQSSNLLSDRQKIIQDLTS